MSGFSFACRQVSTFLLVFGFRFLSRFLPICAIVKLFKGRNSMSDIKYPEIEVQLTGTDGNAFAIMGAVSKALRRAEVPQEEIDSYINQSKSGDYDNLLRTAMKWVSVS